MSTESYIYSTMVKCKIKSCGQSGAHHPVDMNENSPTYGICTPCRFGETPVPPRRKKKPVK